MSQKSSYSFFNSSVIFSALGMVLAAGVGFYYGEESWGAAAAAVFTALILSILEVSISFDNAVVNATVLKKMTPVWQHRFLTWGMVIAVFGMRLVFPLVIVAVVAAISPWEALRVAALDPQRYASIMLGAHHQVAAFGGAFLALVALKYFFDAEKEIHWIKMIEEPLVKLSRLDAVEVGLVLLVLVGVTYNLPSDKQLSFLISGIAGIATFLAVDAIGTFLQVSDDTKHDIHRASFGMFLYLEVLDASFSFDGVVGAFAITNNLFLIAIGLGIGAMFVRSLTIFMVERGTLEQYRFLEHGAFYAVGALALIMFTGTLVHIPEIVTGAIGVLLIGLSVWSSVKFKNKAKKH